MGWLNNDRRPVGPEIQAFAILLHHNSQSYPQKMWATLMYLGVS